MISNGYVSQVAAEVQLLQVQWVKVQLSQAKGAHRMLNTCVKIRTEPVVTSAQRAQLQYIKVYKVWNSKQME